jgi:hypothetical protein
MLVCGDVSDVTNNGGTAAPATDCNMACSGDGIHLCGGPSRLQLYLGTALLPTGRHRPILATMRYALLRMYTMCYAEGLSINVVLHAGLIPPLLATVGINGKVSFLEKAGTSEFANSTGAYELDLSLVPNFNTAWREMHLQTDVFCSAAVVLPDVGRTDLNVSVVGRSIRHGVSDFMRPMDLLASMAPTIGRKIPSSWYFR